MKLSSLRVSAGRRHLNLSRTNAQTLGIVEIVGTVLVLCFHRTLAYSDVFGSKVFGQYIIPFTVSGSMFAVLEAVLTLGLINILFVSGLQLKLEKTR